MQNDRPSSIFKQDPKNIAKKIRPGDKVAILSPSSAAPATWPHVYELGIKNLKNEFDLLPVEYPTTRKQASFEDKIADLEAAFADPDIKAVIATIGGDCEIEYVKKINPKTFVDNPKPFFGFSDNTHISNFLWLNGIPSYYGGSIFTQYASKSIDDFTKRYLKIALFDEGMIELQQSEKFIKKTPDWNSTAGVTAPASYAENEGWVWDGDASTVGISWGGCLESIDELLRHDSDIPSLQDFSNIVLITETSEELPSPAYCYRVYRALGERGILSRVKAVLCGRPQSWFFDNQLSISGQAEYRKEQREAILRAVRRYNTGCTVVQNMDFGHTNPQIPFPYGRKVVIDANSKKIYAEF